MAENTRTIHARKEEFGGDCAICCKPVELHTEGDPWIITCGCGSVEVPNWAMFAQRSYLKRWEVRTVNNLSTKTRADWERERKTRA
jgi:hypothetical protein